MPSGRLPLPASRPDATSIFPQGAACAIRSPSAPAFQARLMSSLARTTSPQGPSCWHASRKAASQAWRPQTRSVFVYGMLLAAWAMSRQCWLSMSSLLPPVQNEALTTPRRPFALGAAARVAKTCMPGMPGPSPFCMPDGSDFSPGFPCRLTSRPIGRKRTVPASFARCRVRTACLLRMASGVTVPSSRSLCHACKELPPAWKAAEAEGTGARARLWAQAARALLSSMRSLA